MGIFEMGWEKPSPIQVLGRFWGVDPDVYVTAKAKRLAKCVWGFYGNLSGGEHSNRPVRTRYSGSGKERHGEEWCLSHPNAGEN